MNGQSGPLSPVSIRGGSDWSSRYQSPDPSYSQANLPKSRGNLATPPVSGSSQGLNGNFVSGMNRRPGDRPGIPSPPNSISRSSNGTTLSDNQGRKAQIMEEALSQHYTILKRYLAQSLREEEAGAKPNRGKDKLLRLSAIQFQELSTDVSDELLRRQSAAAQGRGGQAGAPDHLLPKDNFHPKRNQARQKLSDLPPPRFRYLATDVFYELERRYPRFAGGMDRRGSPANSMRGPPSRQGTPNGFRPGSRDQGPPAGRPGNGVRQNSLGGQVLAGLGIPGLGAPDDTYDRPTAKTFQSNTIIPNKSTLVEDDDDQTLNDDTDDIYGLSSTGKRDTSNTSNTSRSLGSSERDRKAIADYEVQVGELQEKVDSLESRVREQDSELDRLGRAARANETSGGAQREEWKQLRSDLENKLTSALNLNNNLQSELDKVRSYHAESERDLRSQLDDFARRGSGNDMWKGRYESLDREHQELQKEVQEQQRVTNEVRQEALGFLNEMRILSDRSGLAWEQEEKLMQQVHRLEDEVQDWKNRYARSKSHIRSLRASSMGLSLQQPDATQFTKDVSLADHNGMVKDVHVTEFQITVDGLLRVARIGEPQTVLDQMKSLVGAVRHICQDLGDAATGNDEQSQQLAKLRSKISATANNLITACKNFAFSNGLSPVSLLDAAASHLSASVIELIRAAKIRLTDGDEAEDGVSGYPEIQESWQSMPDSNYSPMSSPPQTRIPLAHGGVPNGTTSHPAPELGFGMQGQDRELEELKIFLEDQTEGLVQSIQLLVGAIRAGEDLRIVDDNVKIIADIVGHVVAESRRTMRETDISSLQERAGPTVSNLDDSRRRLISTNQEVQSSSAEETKRTEMTRSLAPLAFEIAKQTKELVQRVDQIEHESNDDFR